MYKLTKEQEQISKRNYKKAVDYFKSIGQWEDGMVLHHLNTSLRHNDVEEYIKWEDVVPMKNGEHTSLHQKGKVVTEEQKRKQSEAMKGKPAWNKGLTKDSDERVANYSNKLKGKPFSEDHKSNIGKAIKGREPWNKGLTTGHLSEDHKRKVGQQMKNRTWCNNGTISKLVFEIPEGFVPGRLKKGDSHVASNIK